MSLLHPILRLLLIAIAAGLSSCIDSREEYWLGADGSGRAEITCHLPVAAATLHGGESGLREMILGFLKDTPEIANSACEVVIEGKRVRVKVSMAFDSAFDLREIGRGASMQTLPAAASHFAGEITAGLRGRTLEYSRKITASKALPGLVFMSAAQIEGHRMTYIMHLPSAATESNATRVENAGRTLVWDIPLSQALKSPVVTRFKMEIPIPWLLVSAIAIPLSGVTLAAVLLRRRKLRNRFPVEISESPCSIPRT